MKMCFNKFCKNLEFDKDMFSDKFKKKFKKYNEIIEWYLPGKKGKMIESKEEPLYNYDDSIMISLLIDELDNAMDEFRKMNPNIKDLDNDIYNNLVCCGLLIREFMHEVGNELKEENFDKIVLWGRDAALIPCSKETEYYIAGESSNTHKGKYYKPIRNFIKYCSEYNIYINKEVIKDFILENIELDKNLKEFNEKIDNFIDDSNTCFFDTGFTGAQMFRTSIFLDKEIPIFLMSKNDIVNYGKELGLEENRVVFIEDIEKPITSYYKFDKANPFYLGIYEEYKKFSSRDFIAKEIEKHIDKVVFTHIGFEFYDKEKNNIGEKISKYI
jgi:hypothetical protein